MILKRIEDASVLIVNGYPDDALAQLGGIITMLNDEYFYKDLAITIQNELDEEVNTQHLTKILKELLK